MPARIRPSPHWARRFVSRVRAIFGPSTASPRDKKWLMRKSFRVVKQDPTIRGAHERAVKRVGAHLRIRNDTPEGRKVKESKSRKDNLQHDLMWVVLSRQKRREEVKNLYTRESSLAAGDSAINSLPFSKERRRELSSRLHTLYHSIEIPTKYYGNLVRTNQTEPREDIAGMRRNALKLIRPVLSGWAARLFLARYYSYFHSYTSGKKKVQASKKT